MSLTFAQFKAGVRQVESGGNYGVVNSIGAVGAYQVMKANIPSWTKRALGYSMSWQQFRDSPAAQEKVADTVLGDFFRKYGAEGAASMWFSGQPNPNSSSSDGGNTVRQYVDKVIAASGGQSSAPAGGGGGAVGGTAVTPKLSMDELATQYGLSSSLINSSKELKSLFNQAVSGSWSATLFQAKLKNTKWWSTQPDSLRQFVTQKYVDPATWTQKWRQGQSDMNTLAVQVGLGNQVNGHGQSSQLLKDAIYTSLALGWSDARIKDWMGSKTQMHNGTMWGDAGTAFDQLHSLSYLNGMKYGSWYTTEARAIASGRATLEDAEASIRNQAAAKYSAFADQIRAGQNVHDLAAPYIQSVSKILEVPQTDVDVFNSHVSQAMTSNKGGQATSIWQFEQSLRQDPTWKKTQNAQDGAMATAHQVLTQMGLTF